MTRHRAISDINAEKALVGAALIDHGVLDLVAIEPAKFVHPELAALWASMLALHGEGKPFDELLVAEHAKVAPLVVTACMVATVTAANAEHYANIVRKHALTRAVLDTVADIAELHRRGEAAGGELLDAALARITALDIGVPATAMTIGGVLRERFGELDAMAEARQNGQPYIPGVPTGIDKLDDFLGGLQRGIVTIACGRPGQGKSAFALGCADAASERGYGVHVFSLEDARSAYADRTLARNARVPAQDIRAGRLTRQGYGQLVNAAAKLMKREGWLYEDTSDISADELVRAVRRSRSQNNTQLVVLDYLQLLRRPRRYESVHDAITQNMVTLARAAKHDNIAYLVLSQLSRKVEARQDKRPQMGDLRESGSIEERSKCILGLYRGAYYGEPQAGIDYDENAERREDRHRPAPEEWERRVDILVLKNSQGGDGLVRCRWDGPTMRIH